MGLTDFLLNKAIKFLRGKNARLATANQAKAERLLSDARVTGVTHYGPAVGGTPPVGRNVIRNYRHLDGGLCIRRIKDGSWWNVRTSPWTPCSREHDPTKERSFDPDARFPRTNPDRFRG